MRRWRVEDERGQATVEFAIVIPLVMLLILGIIEFSKAFNYWITLNHLSNEGARWAAVDKVPPYAGNAGNATPTCDDIKNYLISQIPTGDLQNKVKGTPPTLNNIKLVVTPSAPGAAPEIGDPVTVTVAAPDYSLASLGESFLGDFGKITLSGKSTMRLEQVPSWASAASPSC